MYLLMKLYSDQNYQGWKYPHVLALDLEKTRLEDFAEAARRVAALDPPKPERIQFVEAKAQWFAYVDAIEDCDFYEELCRSEAVLVDALPECLTPEYRVAREESCLTVEANEPYRFHWQSAIKNTSYPMTTRCLTIETLSRLPRFEGSMLASDEEDWAPGR